MSRDVGGGLQIAAAAQAVDQGSVDAHGGVDVEVIEGGRGGQAGEAQPAGEPAGGGGVDLDCQQSLQGGGHRQASALAWSRTAAALQRRRGAWSSARCERSC